MNIKVKHKNKVWVVYILRCSDDSLYTGITNNIEKRFSAHNQGTAAKYTRSRRPVKLLITSAQMDRGDAMRLEIQVKKLPKTKKMAALEKHTGKKKSKREKKLICQECPNGCNLTLEWENAENVFITGNKCASGLVYAARIIRRKKNVHIHAREEMPQFSRETLKAVTDLWQVRLKRLHHKIPVQGSPERSVFRVVLEDKNGKYFVLEQIPVISLKHKRQIATTLDFLFQKNLLRIQPYLTDAKGKHVIKYKNNFWQMIPFVRGIPLDREKYMYEDRKSVV
jgi:putative endonuclease